MGETRGGGVPPMFEGAVGAGQTAECVGEPLVVESGILGRIAPAVIARAVGAVAARSDNGGHANARVSGQIVVLPALYRHTP